MPFHGEREHLPAQTRLPLFPPALEDGSDFRALLQALDRFLAASEPAGDFLVGTLYVAELPQFIEIKFVLTSHMVIFVAINFILCDTNYANNLKGRFMTTPEIWNKTERQGEKTLYSFYTRHANLASAMRAAPDLLSSLESLYAMIVDEQPGCGEFEEMEQARAAIAKAKEAI